MALSRPDRATNEYVYAIRGESTEMVKLGRTTDVLERLRALRLGSPSSLILLGHWRGGADAEQLLHDRFAEQRSHGEWFRFDAAIDVAAVVTSALGTQPEPVLDETPRRARTKARRVSTPQRHDPDPVDWGWAKMPDSGAIKPMETSPLIPISYGGPDGYPFAGMWIDPQ